MDVVLKFTCQHCGQQLMDQRTSFAPGSSAKIYVDEYTKQFGKCCNRPARMVSVEVVEPDKVVESTPAQTITHDVKGAHIDYQAGILTITDTAGVKHTVPLDKPITATMTGFPDQETTSMQAYNLGDYMSEGYIIEQISYEQ